MIILNFEMIHPALCRLSEWKSKAKSAGSETPNEDVAMTLPAALRAFFSADADNTGAPPLAAFTPDAVVRDEGKTHTGHAAIAAWWTAAKAAYRHTAEPLETTGEADLTRVRARVSGDFPGSPAVLTFAFRTEGGLITRLEIGA